jgi:hypothetical protein
VRRQHPALAQWQAGFEGCPVLLAEVLKGSEKGVP